MLDKIYYSEDIKPIRNKNKISFQRLKKRKIESNFISEIVLILNACFLLLSFISLIRISHITKIRISRLTEIKQSYLQEEDYYKKLTRRFDNLFSQNGQQRFMKDQDQMISKDILRVIWR
tara:strand:- start:3844 stop:4203 length:360 start_codon:yes stop_codon:yes gene_type:complete